MILQQLYNDAENILGQALPPAMYKPDAVRWVIPLTTDGQLDGTEWIRLGDAKRGDDRLIPYPGPRSGVRLVPSLIVDYPAYVLGLDDDSKRPAAKHAAYRQLIKQCLDETGNSGLRAIDQWLDRWDAGLEKSPIEMTPQDRIAFRVAGVYPTDESDVQAFWAGATATSDDSPRGRCLVTGIEGPIEKSLPGMLKGIPGGQTAGVALVSANAPAFESFGRERACTSPISRDAAERFTKALNHLLAGERSCIRVGGLAYVFWTRSGPDVSVSGYLGADPDPASVQDLISTAWSGKVYHVAGMKDSQDDFFALALSATAARAVVRDWLHTTVPIVQQNLADWFLAQEIVARDGSEAKKYYGARSLAASLYREFKDIPQHVPPLLIRSALHGDPLPESLLAQAVLRVRAEQRLTQPRAALIKAILVMQKEDVEQRREYARTMSKLNYEQPPAYHCGRLLAELEVVQRTALGKINTTLIDRYYGAASTTPAVVFGILLTNANKAHLPKIRKTRPGVYSALQRRLEEIMEPLKGDFPNTLNLREQALFSLGFYHQRAEDRSQAAAARAARDQGRATAEQAALADEGADDETLSEQEETR